MKIIILFSLMIINAAFSFSAMAMETHKHKRKADSIRQETDGKAPKEAFARKRIRELCGQKFLNNVDSIRNEIDKAAEHTLTVTGADINKNEEMTSVESQLKKLETKLDHFSDGQLSLIREIAKSEELLTGMQDRLRKQGQDREELDPQSEATCKQLMEKCQRLKIKCSKFEWRCQQLKIKCQKAQVTCRDFTTPNQICDSVEALPENKDKNAYGFEYEAGEESISWGTINSFRKIKADNKALMETIGEAIKSDEKKSEEPTFNSNCMQNLLEMLTNNDNEQQQANAET